MNNSTRKRLESLLSARIDDELSEDQVDELNFLLRDDPENRRFYLWYMDLQSRLASPTGEPRGETIDWRSVMTELASPHDPGGIPQRSRGEFSRRLAKWTPWVLAVASVFCLIVFDLVGRKSTTQRIVTDTRDDRSVRLVSSAGAELFNERLPPIGGMIEYDREYTLVSGLLTLEFPCGAEAIVEAPSIVEIVDPMRMMVKAGKCSLYAPEGAEGFQIDTPVNRIIDRGTRLSINVHDDGDSEIQVVEGFAEVGSLDGEPNQTTPICLSERDAMRLNGSAMNKIRFRSDDYLAMLPDRVIGYRVQTPTLTKTVLSELDIQRDGQIFQYSADELITSHTIHFNAPGDKFSLCLTADSDKKDLGASMDSHLVLNTGWINPGGSKESLNGAPEIAPSNGSPKKTISHSGTMGLGIRFDRPVRNGPGQDVVLFEIQSLIERPEGDAFHVSPLEWKAGLRSRTVQTYDLTTKSPGVIPVGRIKLIRFESYLQNRRTQLATSLDTYAPARTFYAIATGIDLSDLGYDIGDAVDGLFFQDASDNETQFDPTLILGLPETSDGDRQP